MILHTVNKQEAMYRCRAFAGEGDVVVLLEDGVYLACTDQGLRCVAIADDIRARGLSTKVAEKIELIDQSRFVELCVEADKVCAWW